MCGACQRTPGQPIKGNSAASSLASGTRAARKSHARRSTPEVMSNNPSLASQSWPAKSSSAAVSLSTSTGWPLPAAALMRETMLSSR
jgi:hypothetical protein